MLPQLMLRIAVCFCPWHHIKAKKEERIISKHTFLPFVFAPQMKMLAYSLEAWCKL